MNLNWRRLVKRSEKDYTCYSSVSPRAAGGIERDRGRKPTRLCKSQAQHLSSSGCLAGWPKVASCARDMLLCTLSLSLARAGSSNSTATAAAINCTHYSAGIFLCERDLVTTYPRTVYTHSSIRRERAPPPIELQRAIVYLFYCPLFTRARDPFYTTPLWYTQTHTCLCISLCFSFSTFFAFIFLKVRGPLCRRLTRAHAIVLSTVYFPICLRSYNPRNAEPTRYVVCIIIFIIIQWTGTAMAP